MDAIKKFFNKKKNDAKFANVGAGHRLNEEGSRHIIQSRSPNRQRVEPSSSAQRAGEAAVSRLSKKPPTDVDWSMQAIKAQARRELEAEKKLKELSVSRDESEAAPPVATVVEQHVLFSSPLLGGEVGTYDVIKTGIRETLHSQLGEDKGIAACLIIYTCNKGVDKVKVCVDTLCKYVENIVNNPTEEKFRRIRMSNKAYQERVHGVEGAVQFLEAVGFKQENLPHEGREELFWVFPFEGDVSKLQSLSESLKCAEPVRPVLERSPALLLPRQAARLPELPSEFFTLTKDEILREAQLKHEMLEQSMVLRTKAMRERDSAREMRKYRFTYVRIRFSEGLTLQGTFRASEKLEEVYEFTRKYLFYDWRPFDLSLSGAKKFTFEDRERSLAELVLVPTALLNFSWDESITDPQLDDNVTLGQAAYLLIPETEAAS